MSTLLALRNLAHRPWRSIFLLTGYALGVGVMITLLSIGEALLSQAREERLVGGGQITVLPEGLDVEVMKTGGVGGLFFSIDNARFIYRQLLAAPRLAADVQAVAPQIDGKLLYLRTPRGEVAVRAAGEIPSRNVAVGAAPRVIAGVWGDDDGDRRWATPTPRELYSEIDHFHQTPRSVEHPESWGEWHYFNVLSSDRRHWAFISYIIGGDVPHGTWGGQVAVTLREQEGPTRRFGQREGSDRITISTSGPDLALGPSTVRLRDDGSYVLHAEGKELTGGAPLVLDLVLTPAPRIYFPGAALTSGALTSGYAVPALRATATGTICVRSVCEHYRDAQAYHDHNWGEWRGVTWEWGAGRAGSYTVLYGRVQAPDTLSTAPPIFVFLTDSLGFRALFRPRAVQYVDDRTVVVNGNALRVPSSAVLADARGDDTLRLDLSIDDAIATDTRLPLLERGDASAARALTTPYFVQMKGSVRISGRVGGRSLAGEGMGFFETYR
jgi:hypothetical protein